MTAVYFSLLCFKLELPTLDCSKSLNDETIELSNLLTYIIPTRNRYSNSRTKNNVKIHVTNLNSKIIAPEIFSLTQILESPDETFGQNSSFQRYFSTPTNHTIFKSTTAACKQLDIGRWTIIRKLTTHSPSN